MTVRRETIDRLAGIPNVTISECALLSQYTRFGIGGPAAVLVEAASEEAFTEALQLSQSSGAAYCVIGAGTNLIVSDQGFDGIVLRLAADAIGREGAVIRAQAGAELQALVDYCIDQGLRVVAVRVLVHADVLRQPLGVERPALDEERDAVVLPERGEAVDLLRDRELEVMARAPPRGTRSSRRWCVGDLSKSPVLTFTCPGREPSGVPALYSAPDTLFSRNSSTGMISSFALREATEERRELRVHPVGVRAVEVRAPPRAT